MYLVNNPNLELGCYTASFKEKNALKLLKNNKKLIIDLISLFTIHETNVKQNVVGTFGKLGIAQSSVDTLNQILYEISFNKEEITSVLRGLMADLYIKKYQQKIWRKALNILKNYLLTKLRVEVMEIEL